MEIKSNTFGKLQKIRNGNVFDSPLIFIRELIQNSQRSRAKNVRFTIENNILTCEDDGCGCKNPENVFTLDLSDWESTNEGYGIGFWSCLAVPDIESILVASKSWQCFLDVKKLYENCDLTVKTKTDAEKCRGFKVELRSEWFVEHHDEIKQYLTGVGKYVDMNIYFHDTKILHRDIFDEYEPAGFYKTYNNQYFKAKLELYHDYFGTAKMYYDKRYLADEFIRYAQGIIEVKQGKLTLKEPDRTAYVKDESYYIFERKLNECIRDLYKSYIKLYGVENEELESGILHWLDVKDYEHMLDFDEDMVCMSLEDKAINGGIVDESSAMDITPVDSDSFARKDQYTEQSFHVAAKSDFSTSVSQPAEIKTDYTGNFKQKLKSMKNSVWCEKGQVSTYSKEIQEAEYKGINVIIAKNGMYANVLRHYGFIHISDLSDYFNECYIKKNIELKNGKEEAFIALLQPVCKKFGLAQDTFLICDLSVESRFEVDGKLLHKRKLQNKKGDIQIYGVADGMHIYLDRYALGLNRFNLKKGNGLIGIHEIKAIFANVNTVAHEMAHLIKGTTDNTPEHYRAEIAYQNQIISLFV